MEGATLRQLDDRIRSVINHFYQKNLHGNIQYIDPNSYRMVWFSTTKDIYVRYLWLQMYTLMVAQNFENFPHTYDELLTYV